MNRLTEQFFHAPGGVFTQPEVAVALKGSDYSKHGLIKRAIASGEVLHIRRGLYCLAPRYQKRPVNTYAIAHHIYGPSYISLETALCYHGWIPEAVYACTCASWGNAKVFDTPLGVFRYHRIPQQVFYAGVERNVDGEGNVFFMASPAKALADYVYIHKPDWKSIEEAYASLRIEPDILESISQEQLGRLCGNYSNHRVRKFLTSWKETLSK